jgi:hypothetical protein
VELELPQFTGHFDLLEQGHRPSDELTATDKGTSNGGFMQGLG